MTLDFDGRSPSFAALVKKYGGDIPPGALRTELKRVGAVKEDESGRLSVQMKYFRPFNQDEQLQRALSQAVYGLALNINRNITHEIDERWVERTAFSTRIRLGDNARVRRISQDRAVEFVESVNDLFSAYETIYSDDESGLDFTTVGGVIVKSGVSAPESSGDLVNFFHLDSISEFNSCHHLCQVVKAA